MKKIVLALMAASFVVSSAAMAASDAIMSDRESECAIWLCLPGGFISGCENAKSAYTKRVTAFTSSGRRKYTDLPRFDLCIDENPEGVEDFNVGADSEITYYGAYEVSMPEYNTCTRWSTRTKGSGDYQETVRYCAAIKTTAARTFESSEKYHTYQTIKVGQTSYTTGTAPVRHFTDVLVDGVAVGERYYDDN